MDILFNGDRFQMLEFFSYPCTVCERLVEYEENGCHGVIQGDENVKNFFENCLETVENITGHNHLMCNKIAIKVYDKEMGNTFYVGYKDNIYAIGLRLNPYMTSVYTIKLNENEEI